MTSTFNLWRSTRGGGGVGFDCTVDPKYAITPYLLIALVNKLHLKTLSLQLSSDRLVQYGDGSHQVGDSHAQHGCVYYYAEHHSPIQFFFVLQVENNLRNVLFECCKNCDGCFQTEKKSFLKPLNFS